MKNKIYNIISLAIFSLLISSCNNTYQISTNLNQNNISEYFSASAVTIYQVEKDILSKYRNIGLVEGEACQSKAHHSEPDEITARTDARRNAYKMGANAIIFSGCTLIENNKADKKCIAIKICYGRALLVDKSDDR